MNVTGTCFLFRLKHLDPDPATRCILLNINMKLEKDVLNAASWREVYLGLRA